jgi:phosphate transport system substrate-binding protein
MSSFTGSPANAATASTISGGGSSFQAGFEYACRTAYNTKGGTQVSYDGTLGSGTGMTQFAAGTFSFAGTDGPDLTKKQAGASTAIVVPIAAAPIALIYKVKGKNGKWIKGLRLNSAQLSNIYTGKITHWDDAKLKSQNASIAANLPHTAIVPMVRTSGSGTTKNLTQYLAALNPTQGWTATKDFAASANATKPANLTQQTNSDAMVAGVQTTNGAIGYADLPDTNGETGFDIALLKNVKGQYIAASAASGAKFVVGASPAYFVDGFISGTTADTMFKKAINNAYQLTAFTYLQASATTSDNNTAVKLYAQYALTHCQGKAGYSPLTGNALNIGKAQAAKISAS